MNDLRDKIRELIEQETQMGHFSVLNTTTNVELIQQIISNYEKTHGLKKVVSEEELPKKAELVFVAAPTGAGKDSLVARLNHQNPEKKYIELNMDIFRHYFPEFIENTDSLTDRDFAKMTNEFAYEIYYTIQEILLQEFPGTNIIITGTLRETDWVEQTFERFKSDPKTDYEVRLVCLAVPKKESALSVIHRYVGIVDAQKDRLEYYPGTARYTSIRYHDETYEKFPKHLEYFQKKFEQQPGKLIDYIEVHRRGKSIGDLEEDTKVFSTAEPNKIRTALEAVSQLRAKPYQPTYEEITSIMRKIHNNKDYLTSQGTLKEILKDLAIILDYPDILKRLEDTQWEPETPEDR